MRRISTAARNNKRLARLPTDHFTRLLEEACPNRAYSVRHKLKDYSMMRSFMTLGSLTYCAELDERSDVSDTMPFPVVNTIMTVYRGRPPVWEASRV
jgi:hypothetical protein